jgi:predicted N-formylglutamate amidohydrolase
MITARRRSYSWPNHCGNSIPRPLGRLCVAETELKRQIAWDIGIAAVCRLVTDMLDATLVQQNYSRRVIDCDRPPGSETSIPTISELTPIPGNISLGGGQKTCARVRDFTQPRYTASNVACITLRSKFAKT